MPPIFTILTFTLSLSCLLSLPSTPPPLPSLHIVGHGRAYFTRFTRLNSLELTGRKSLLGARQPAGSYVNFILLSASWINLSLFQPSYIFTSIQNGDAFKRETHKCQREGGVRGYEFETPVPNIYLDEKELFSQRTFEFFTACTPITCPSSSPPLQSHPCFPLLPSPWVHPASVILSIPTFPPTHFSRPEMAVPLCFASLAANFNSFQAEHTPSNDDQDAQHFASLKHCQQKNT